MNRKLYRAISSSLLALAALALIACPKSKSPDVVATPPSTPTTSGRDAFACGLLTADEVQAVQGEPFRATKAGGGPGPGLSISQCYFELPTPANSIVLTVTRNGKGSGAREAKAAWRDIFYSEHPREKEEEEREKKGPAKIDGLGDEAFWTADRVGGALYVLKGDCYLRISVGGAGDQAQKTEKCKTLAAAALKRLP